MLDKHLIRGIEEETKDLYKILQGHNNFSDLITFDYNLQWNKNLDYLNSLYAISSIKEMIVDVSFWY